MAAEQSKASELELNSEQDRNTSDIPDSLLPPHGEKSSFEYLCAKYISKDDRSPSLVNRIAYAMNQDVRVRKICRVKARKHGCDLNDLDEILQRVMEVFVLSMLPKRGLRGSLCRGQQCDPRGFPRPPENGCEPFLH